MNSLRNLLCLIVLVPMLSAPLFADEKPQSLYLSESMTLSFAPDDVFFLVQTAPNTVQRIKAVVVPLNASAGSYIAGVKLASVPQREKVFYSVLILGKGNQFASIPSKAAIQDDLSLESSDQLQDRLATRRSVLVSYNLQVQSQEESLRRLRQDAEVIGNFGRVMETSDEIERMKMDISNAEKSTQSMETLMRLAASMPVPKNALARETQLTGQLVELAQAAKNAEAAEMARKSGMETELRQKLAIVEASRFEDYDTLQRQLDELRTQRMAIEKQKGISSASPSPDATALPVSPDVDY